MRRRLDARAIDKVGQYAADPKDFNVAQVSNLLYRRFPIGSHSPTAARKAFTAFAGWKHCDTAGWETCATTLSTALVWTRQEF
jgi:hypothetical protein